MLREILAKFGQISCKVLHTNFKVKFTVDDVTQSAHCIFGVKQGDILAPILFTFFIAAVMITWKASCKISVCMFRSKMDATLAGRSYWADGESFPVRDSEYVDDTAKFFNLVQMFLMELVASSCILHVLVPKSIWGYRDRIKQFGIVNYESFFISSESNTILLQLFHEP